MKNATPTPERIQALSRELEALLFDAAAPVLGYAAAVIDDGALLCELTGGMRHIDVAHPENNLPVEPDTRFRIASISKVFTALGIMQLCEQGLIDLDGDISPALGFCLRNPHYPNDSITPRMLLSHTSSIRDGSVYSIPPEDAISECFVPGGKYYFDAEHFAAPVPGECDRRPGVYFAYANLNYGILGTAIERLTGQRFDVAMRERVLRPMGLGASFHVGDFDSVEICKLSALYKRCTGDLWEATQPWTAQIDDYCASIQPQNQVLITNPDLGTQNSVALLDGYRVGTNGTLFSPQGGLRVSVWELTRLIHLLLGDGTLDGQRILSPSSINELFTPFWTYDSTLNNCEPGHPAMACYGPGIHFLTSRFNDRAVENRDIPLAGHLGQAYGMLAALYLDRERGFGFSFAFSGLGSSLVSNPGSYSGLYRWQERAISAILDHLFPDL